MRRQSLEQKNINLARCQWATQWLIWAASRLDRLAHPPPGRAKSFGVALDREYIAKTSNPTKGLHRRSAPMQQFLTTLGKVDYC